ncbi:MAG: hypothetical protein AMR96_00955 [Candidatus Adiutrix intracellularis]|nr:MAG: hypothetical protein AMR96_00955 [Candidatus Adiutrix intracellularis]
MKIILTGGQGFLGRRILEFLLAKGHTVLAVVRRTAPELTALGAEIILTNLADLTTLKAAPCWSKGVDGVIHCAAKSGIWGPLNDYIQANFIITFNLATLARRLGATWFVYTSSPSVIHTGQPLAGVDESVPYAENPRHGYPYSKMLAERLILSLNEPSFKTVALRPHLIWGPGDPHLLPRLIQRARSGSLFLFKSTALIDATYIDNAAHAHILAAEKLAAGAEIGGRVYFITQGEPLTAIAMIEKLLAAALPLQSPPHLRPKFQLPATWSRPVSFLLETVWSSLKLTGEPPLTRFLAEELTLPHWFNLSRARVELGYKPIVTLVEGLNRLAASFEINQQ